MLYRSTTALATLAVAFAVTGTAMADPYADEVISLRRENDPTQAYNTTGDTGLDPGTDALGAPDFGFGRTNAITVLGYNPDVEGGGEIVLAFTNNVCVDGPGADIRLYDGNNDETAMVEVSNDGGANYTFVGEGFPGAYDIDLAGSGVASFNQFRVTALDSQTRLTHFAGIDLDAVECLNSADPGPGDPDPTDPPPPADNAALERCDLAAGSAGIDVKDVSLSSENGRLTVKAQFCGPVEEKAYYKVYVDYTRDQAHHRRNYGSWYLRRHFRKRGGLDEPVIDPSAPDGPDTLDGNQLCKRTWDDRAAYRYGRTWGPGDISIDGDELTLTLDYGSLAKGDGVEKGSKVLVWVRSWKDGFRDRAPNVETGDHCARPQFDHEVFEITLD